MKLSHRQRVWFYGTFLTLFVSGFAWYVLHRLGIDQTQRGTDDYAGLESGLLKLHGAATMAFLVVFGALLPTHIKKGCAAKRHLVSGSAVVGMMALLTITGYVLYYAGEEHTRAMASWCHTVLGITSSGILAMHVFDRPMKRRSSRSRRYP